MRIYSWLNAVLVGVGLLFLAACSSNPKSDVVRGDPGCVVGLLNIGKEQVGTAFKLAMPEGPAYLTAAHVLPSSPTADFWITFSCDAKVTRERIIASESLAGVDVAIIRPASPIPEMPALVIGQTQSNALTIPSYPHFSSLDPRLSAVAVDLTANFLHAAEGKIYFLTQLLRPGMSGAPILDKRQEVIGVVSGRFLEGGKYAGIGHGEAISKITAAFASRTSSNGIGGKLRASDSRVQ